MNSSLTKIEPVNNSKIKTTNTVKRQSKRLARQLANYALEKKADKILIMDLRKLTTMTDFFIVCSAESEVQVKSICDHIEFKMKKRKMKALNREGYTNSKWVLLDYVDTIVHIFHKDTRDFYSLETFWGDAKFEEISEEPEAVSSQE